MSEALIIGITSATTLFTIVLGRIRCIFAHARRAPVFNQRVQMFRWKEETNMRLICNNVIWAMADPRGCCPQKNNEKENEEGTPPCGDRGTQRTEVSAAPA